MSVHWRCSLTCLQLFDYYSVYEHCGRFGLIFGRFGLIFGPFGVWPFWFMAILDVAQLKQHVSRLAAAESTVNDDRRCSSGRQHAWRMSSPASKSLNESRTCCLMSLITHNIYDSEVSPNLRYYPKSNTRGNKYRLLNHTFHYRIWYSHICAEKGR